MNSETNEKIQVCVRMRPLLKPHEDDIAWQADENTNTILTVEYNLLEIYQTHLKA